VQIRSAIECNIHLVLWIQLEVVLKKIEKCIRQVTQFLAKISKLIWGISQTFPAVYLLLYPIYSFRREMAVLATVVQMVFDLRIFIMLVNAGLHGKLVKVRIQ